MTVSIGDYTIRHGKTKREWSIFLKVDEHKMLYCGKFPSHEKAEEEKKRLKDGWERWD